MADSAARGEGGSNPMEQPTVPAQASAAGLMAMAGMRASIFSGVAEAADVIDVALILRSFKTNQR